MFHVEHPGSSKPTAMNRSSPQMAPDPRGDGRRQPDRGPEPPSDIPAFLAAQCPEVGLSDRAIWAGQLREYANALQRAAARLSLVSQGDRPHVVGRHILPALRLRAAVRAVPHRRVLDLGSGAGLPGIPLKISLPEAEFFFVESRRRRANFLRQVIRQLQLKHAHVVNGRLEDWTGPADGVDVVLSRAVKLRHELVGHVSRCLAAHGALLTTVGPEANAMSGARLMVRQQLGRRDGSVRCALWRA